MKRSIRWIDYSRNKHNVRVYTAFDESLRSKLHSTNPLERVNKEIKRRTNVVGTFPNYESVLVRASRLTVGASAMGLEPMAASWRTAGAKRREWAVSRRYMPVEKLTGLCNDNPETAMIPDQ